MKYIENIVIKKPLCTPESIFAINEKDWVENEEDKTYWTDETFLPQILVDLGIVKSRNEVRKNKPQLFINLDKFDYIEVKWGKRKLFILVGEDELPDDIDIE